MNGFRTTLKESTGLINGYMSQALIRLNQENIGWSLLSGDADDHAIPFDVIRGHAARARRLGSLNPIVKRGLIVRNAYMWTDPVSYIGDDDSFVFTRNKDQCFSQTARVRDEIAFCTDGCVTYLIDKQERRAFAIPLSRVHGTASDETTNEVCALRVSVKAHGTDNVSEWVPIAGAPTVVEDSQYPMSKRYTCVYVTVNAMSGERYGKPDLMTALYYAQAYKEYLETAHLMTKALAKLAYKTTSINARQQQAVVGKMGASGVGGTASVGMGQDITAVSKAGAGIDFSAGSPLAAMVSAALDIPLSVLLTDGSAGGRQGAETALEDPTFKALELRRGVHKVLVDKVAQALGLNIIMDFGAINNDQTHRRVQSLVLAYENGAIHQDELRSAVLQILRMAGAHDVNDLPDATMLDAGSVGALSDGTNDTRDNPTEA